MEVTGKSNCHGIYTYRFDQILYESSVLYDIIYTHSRPPMKIFDLIAQLTRKISQTVISLLVPQQKSHRSRIPHIQRAHNKQKTVKKRKSFHSFLKQQHQDLLSSSGRRRRRHVKNALQFESQRQFQKQPVDDGQCSPNQSNLEEVNTKQLLYPSSRQVDREPIFIDKDGLEISVIEQRDNRFDQLNNSGQSDPEILKFLFGQENQPSPSLAQGCSKAPVQLPRKEWWKQVLQDDSCICSSNSLNERLSTIKQGLSGAQAQNNYSGGARKVKSRKRKQIRHQPRPEGLRRCPLKIINLIDLAWNEDCPRLFQIPLKRAEEGALQ